MGKPGRIIYIHLDEVFVETISAPNPLIIQESAVVREGEKCLRVMKHLRCEMDIRDFSSLPHRHLGKARY